MCNKWDNVQSDGHYLLHVVEGLFCGNDWLTVHDPLHTLTVHTHISRTIMNVCCEHEKLDQRPERCPCVSRLLALPADMFAWCFSSCA